ncbi:alcohol dehydrogenase catalytic domain-containing protein [Sphingomonas sp. BK580]|uniref:alcohol dehydrogenase catalytic domain-containing protein n=1 Tax=Sphingomonas sp. BK580 TaxID=2586972 RepID=UPI001610FC05|nr:alcohol dehydrogenase catalytic domain-containing protein [Sphingomonas sp. BK580]MBB3695587.1 NADPH:quinone reductase-like Zn-dependent oxidoreductase [Sphingomonas sp. BK580]
MKAIVQDALGEAADVLRVIDIAESAEPRAGEILIDVTLAPVHHGDLQLIRSQPFIPEDTRYVRRGSEAVGIVRALGSDISGHANLSVGDRVIAFPTAGSWAESIAVPAFAVVPVPADIKDEVAGQLLINFITARMIVRGLRKSVSDEVLRDGAVLVTGAGSVVARLLLHMLRQEGVVAIGLARAPASAERVASELNGVPVVATSGLDWQDQVRLMASNKKIIGVLDCVSGPLLAQVAQLLADDAVIVTYGALGGVSIDIGAPQLIGQQLVVRGVVFSRWFTEVSPDEQVEDVRSAFAVARALPSLFRTGSVFDLDHFRDAVRAVEAPGRAGFVFLRP